MAELKRRRSENPYLREEIFFNILVRLPVKHILRFKTVCKSWLAIITSDKFVKYHLDHIKRYPCHEDGAFIFKSDEYDDMSLYVASLDSETRSRAVKLDLVDRLDFENMIGCCNGLVLCQLKWVEKQRVPDLVLVNPSTLRYKILPTFLLLPSLVITSYYNYCEGIGFGYDHITDDYKVVVIVLNDEHEDETFIYSSRADSWRKFTGDMPVIKSRTSYSKGVLLNNHLLHWYIRCDTRQVLHCFDITMEKWSMIPLPVRWGRTIRVTDMGVQNGLLFISSKWYEHNPLPIFGEDATSYVWVMKEYGVKDSWAKELNKTQQLGDDRCEDWKIAPIANNYAQGDGDDSDEIWLTKIDYRRSISSSTTLEWYAIREGKKGLFTSTTVQFPSSILVDYMCYTGCNRTLVLP